MYTRTERYALAAGRFFLGAALAAVVFALVWIKLGGPFTSLTGTLFIVITVTCGSLGLIWGDSFFRLLRKVLEDGIDADSRW